VAWAAAVVADFRTPLGFHTKPDEVSPPYGSVPKPCYDRPISSKHCCLGGSEGFSKTPASITAWPTASSTAWKKQKSSSISAHYDKC
jgi:hypothetical protein